ncbi:cytochrome c oxidase subunit II [Candidatus Peregrinibacteria bacterium]|nr:cytochrome c oxidase subunit II [Candidatus Peregrinibacteria bacterium]
MPENINNAPYAHEIDNLYMQIMWVVLIAFFLTEGCLIYFIIRYRYKKGNQATYLHGNQKAELVWSIIPGFILLWIALSQIGALNQMKDMPKESESIVVQSFPRQFEWWFRYRGDDDKHGTEDDLMTNGQLCVPVNKKIVMKLSAKDVIHSFFLPQARVKQDALPGILTKVWFEIGKIPCWNLKMQAMELLNESEFNNKKVVIGATDGIDPLDVFDFKNKPVSGKEKTGQKTYYYEKKQGAENVRITYQGKISTVPIAEVENEYILHHLEIACAELCGAEHYKMRGILIVVPEGIFKEWLSYRGGFSVAKSEQWRDIWDKYHPEYN